MASTSLATTTPPARAGRWLPAGAVGCAAALAVVHAASGAGGVRDWTYLVVISGAAVVACAGALRTGRHLVAGLIALGVVLTAVGDTTNQILIWVRPSAPDVSAADIPWIGSYLALIAAMLLLLREGHRRLDVDGWIDLGSVTTLAVLIQWEVSVRDLAVDVSLPVGVRIIWILYPAFDAVLLVLVARALFAGQLRSPLALLLTTGVGSWLLADVAFTVAVPDGHSNPIIDVGWLAGSVALAAAAWGPKQVGADAGSVADGWELTKSSDPAPASVRAGYGRILAGLLPLAVPGLVEIIGSIRGTDPDPWPLFIASVALIAAAFFRSVRLLQSDFEARSRLRGQEHLAMVVAELSSDAVALVDAAATVQSSAPRFADLLGFGGLDLRGYDLFTTVHPDDLQLAHALFDEVLGSPGHMVESELRVRHADGHVLWFGIRAVALLDDPDVHSVIVTLHDATTRRVAQDDLAHQALHDALTGLANRVLFTDRLNQALRRAERSEQRPAVIFLDLDGFKTVNDSLGHGPGDDLLKEVSARLSSTIRPGDTVARFGGDEFAILIESGQWPLHDAQVAADRILRVLTAPVTLGDQVVAVSASLGIAVGDADATAASMLRDADIAMYRAKATGRGRWVAFDGAMRTEALERLQIGSDLAVALDQGQLALIYQPVVELSTERVVGFEALVRWQHPRLGVLEPEQFLPVAEENGLIMPIGAWVFATSFEATARWHRDYPDQSHLTLSVNISGRQLASSDIAYQLEQALADSGLDPRSLVVDITESALIRDPERVAEGLGRIRSLGIRIALDDFGTGYSSLGYLRMFPLDIMKIDPSFVELIDDADQVPAMLRGLLDLAHTLDLVTHAEGVERDVQRDGLRAAGCDLAQGFLFGRPLDPADAEALLLRLATNA